MPLCFVRAGYARHAFLVAVVLLVFSAVAPLVAQAPADLSLEELLNVKVYSASKHEQTTSEAPSSITVITRDDIDKHGYRDLYDVLRNVSGFYVRNHGTYRTLGVRGFAPSDESGGRILLLVNGHTINDNINGSAPLGAEFPVDVDLIDRIEVVRGPSSSLYGADAFFGVVNVVTRAGKTMKAATLSTELASQSTRKQTVSWGVDHKQTQALLSATYGATEAPGKLGAVQDPVGSRDNRGQERRLFALASSHGFTFQTAISSLQEKVPSSAQWCGSCHQADTHATNFRGYADLQYEHTLGKRMEVSARGYYDTTSYHGKYEQLHTCNDALCHGSAMDYDTAQGNWAGGELKFTRHLREKDRIIVGTEYRNNFRQSQSNYLWYQPPTSPNQSFIPYVDYNQGSHFWGVYTQGEFQLAKNVILNAGVRTDVYNVFGTTTNPRAALIFTPRKATTLKFMVGSAFRAPSFSQMYAAGMNNAAAPELKPEKIRSYEAVWQQQLGKRITLETRGFYSRIGRYIESQPVVIDGVSGSALTNSSGTAKGMEFELHGRLPKGMEGRMSYSLQDAHDTVDGGPLAYSPRHLGAMNLDIPLFHKFMTAGLEAQYMSQCLAANSASGYSSTPAMVNATVSTRPLKWGLSFSASAYNLVGHSMSDPLAPYAEQTHTVPSTSLLPDDRRTFRFKITWTSKGENSKSGMAKTETKDTHSQDGN